MNPEQAIGLAILMPLLGAIGCPINRTEPQCTRNRYVGGLTCDLWTCGYRFCHMFKLA